jgi:hypothetical protein
MSSLGNVLSVGRLGCVALSLLLSVQLWRGGGGGGGGGGGAVMCSGEIVPSAASLVESSSRLSKPS